MSRARYYDVIQYPDNASEFVKFTDQVTVTVYDAGSSTPLSDTIYQANSGSATYGNPFTTPVGSKGTIEFYLTTEKSVKLVITSGILGTITLDNVGVWPDPGLLRTSIRSIPNGTYQLSYIDEGNGILTAPGLLSKYGGWDLEVDGGLTPGNSSAHTTNATKFQTLMSKIANLGGGDIIVNHQFFLDNIHLNHGLNRSVPINIIGAPGRGLLQHVGTTGPFIDIGATSADQMDHIHIADVTVVHSNPVDPYPTIRLGRYVLDTLFDRYHDASRGRPDIAQVQPCEAAYINIEAKQGFTMRNSKLETRTDSENLALYGPKNLYFTNVDDFGGPQITNSDISGCMDKSIGMFFGGTGLIDTPILTSLLIKDHERGIVVNNNTGDVANLQASNIIIDGITGTCIYLEPINGCDVYTWNFSNYWMKALDHILFFSGSNGGSVTGMHFHGGYMTDALLTGIYAQGGGNVKILSIENTFMNFGMSSSSEYGLLIGDTSAFFSGCKAQGNTVVVPGGAGGAAKFSTNGQAFKVDNNLWVGVTAIQGFTAGSNGNTYNNNSFIASL